MSASCDFKNQLTGEVCIPSTWKKEVTLTEVGSQTKPLKVREQETQTVTSALQAVDQLDKNEGTEPRKNLRASLQGLQYVYEGALYDPERVATFLEASKDGLLSLLYKNVKSSVFDKYEPNWSKRSTELSAVYTLSSPYAVEADSHALGVSWNANGTMLAVAYGRIDTSGWCYSKGYVGVWNLIRPDMDENAPHYTLELDSYATCVAFHPINPLMLAVGTYGGEVIVYPNVADNLPAEWSTNQSSAAHQEPISSLQWVLNLQEPREAFRYVLCSAGQDSQLAYWTTANKLVSPLALYSVRNKRRLPVGVEAMSYARSGSVKGSSAPSVDAVLLVGLESGDVGRGRTGFAPLDAEGSNEVTAVPLELDWMDGHRGPVHALRTSPFFRHLFITCSSDGSAHLYNDLERAPLLTLQPSAETKHFLYDAQFSPFRPSVLALVSRSSFLHIYDLQNEQAKPLYATEAGVDGAAVVSLAFNEASSDWLATGDVRGCVRVWRLPTDIVQPTEQERAALRATQQSSGKAEHVDTEKNAVRTLLGFTL